jgi:serine/threonine protein kinase
MGDEVNMAVKCSQCGATLTSNAPEGLCPRCLLALNLGPETEMPGDSPGSTRTPVAEPPSLDEIAARFPQLEILRCLGRGGMGVVYQARQTQLNRLVALKILAPEKERDAQFAGRFVREAQALARLNHPNIVGVHDFGETGGLYYLLMEYVDGVSLRHLLHSHRIKPEEALAIVPKICEALQYAHDHGIVHRDVKPENILLDRQGQVKIADFGIAKLLGSDRPQPAITLDQQIIGTPHYMAPEQVEKPHLVDHRADIYSLGVVFYELLTGELPLGQFQPPSKKAAVDVRLDEVVLGALAKEPDRRYQQASEIKTDVETIAASPPSIQAELGSPESAAEVVPPMIGVPLFPPLPQDHLEPDRSSKRARRTAIIVGLITVALLLGLLGLGGIVAWWLLPSKPSALATNKPAMVESNPAVVEALPPIQSVIADLLRTIPPRDPQAGRNLIDLTAHYNAALGENWHEAMQLENHLGEVPSGVQTLAGTQFDVRGLIQVEQKCRRHPPKIEGIQIGQRCQRLHFVHAAINAALIEDGAEIGRYVVHYVDGERQDIPIVLGQDVLDWWKQPKATDQRLVVAWEGDNPKSRRQGKKIRLFKSTWENPSPQAEVRTIDFEATRPGPSPFLIALTAE